MALYDPITGMLRGKLGSAIFAVRYEYNYARKYTVPRDPKAPLVVLHRSLFGQLQGLGRIWNEAFIKPFFSGDLETQIPYNRFIHYNWPRWNKVSPVTLSAVPFWGYGVTPTLLVQPNPLTDLVTITLYPPESYSVQNSVAVCYAILTADGNYSPIDLKPFASQRWEAQLPNAAEYLDGLWSVMAWVSDKVLSVPVSEVARG
jgi:hypothetical protein